MKWLRRRHKTKQLQDRTAEKHKDYMRPVRIIERLHLRIQEASENNDINRVNVLLRRARRVRDFQIAEWGH